MYKQIGNGLFVLSDRYVDLYYQIQEKTKSFIKDVELIVMKDARIFS